MEGALKQSQETAIVMAGIQARQAEVLKGHSQWLEDNERAATRHREMMAGMEDKLNGVVVILADMDDKLNGVIAILDDMVRRDKRQQ